MEPIQIALICIILLQFFFMVLIIWYAKRLVYCLQVAQKFHELLFARFIAFNEHLRKVYQMEMFYGDETLKTLLEHGKNLSSLLDEFGQTYSEIDDGMEQGIEDLIKEEEYDTEADEEKETIEEK